MRSSRGVEGEMERKGGKERKRGGGGSTYIIPVSYFHLLCFASTDIK